MKHFTLKSTTGNVMLEKASPEEILQAVSANLKSRNSNIDLVVKYLALYRIFAVDSVTGKSSIIHATTFTDTFEEVRLSDTLREVFRIDDIDHILNGYYCYRGGYSGNRCVVYVFNYLDCSKPYRVSASYVHPSKLKSMGLFQTFHTNRVRLCLSVDDAIESLHRISEGISKKIPLPSIKPVNMELIVPKPNLKGEKI